MYGAGDVCVIDVPDATISRPTDALVRMPADPAGTAMGHEFIGVVEEAMSSQSVATRALPKSATSPTDSGVRSCSKQSDTAPPTTRPRVSSARVA